MYDYFVSLGWNCLIASTMGKYGIRSSSGPFDWVWSDLELVLQCMDNDFKNFLERNNINFDVSKPTYFEDKIYKIQFFHDVKYNFEAEYEKIYQKYLRRISRFQRMTKCKTCFIRLVKNEAEMSYISKNADYILNIIKRNNRENNIIFLIPKFLGGAIPFQSFWISIYDYSVYWGDGTRDIFEMNKKLVAWLNENMDVVKAKDNLLYNRRRENIINQRLTQQELISRITLLQDRLSIVSEKYHRMLEIENADFDNKLTESIVIYGIGDIGKALYKKIKTKCKVEAFLDLYIQETEFDGIPIMRPNERNSMVDKLIIIVPMYDFDKIEDMLQRLYGSNNRIVSLDEFCQNKDK